MEKNLVSETLKKIFKHWNDKQISDLTAHIFFKYGHLNKIEENAVLDLLNKTIIEALKTYPLENIQPGLIQHTLPQRLGDQKKKDQKNSENVKLSDLEVYTQKESKGKDFSLEKYREKLERLEKYVLQSCDLTGKEIDFFRIWMKVLKKDTTLTASPVFNIAGISEDLMDEFFVEAQNQLEISDEYFRKLLSTIRKKLRDKRNDITGEMMSFIPAADADLEELKAFLIAQINFSMSSRKCLTAYRFSVEELDKMIWLKELFEENGFNFDPNRFPEVYYDDYDKVNPDDNNWNPENINPDAFGIYRYRYEISSNLPCADSYEGHIVLFKDRIEAYCNRSGADIDSVRFVVLMHELGHWLSHWPKKDNYNWKIGFHLPNKHTKEALAQLIAYWACAANPVHFETLLKLTPKVVADPDKLYILRLAKDALLNDGTVINTEDPYGRYWLLKDKPKAVILNKLHQLREGWMLKDEKMMEFLISDIEDIYKWIQSTETMVESEYCLYDENELITNSCIYKFSSRMRKSLFPKKGLDLLGALSEGNWYNTKFIN